MLVHAPAPADRLAVHRTVPPVAEEVTSTVPAGVDPEDVGATEKWKLGTCP